MRTTSVLIAGAGPTGLTLALALTKANIPCLLLDRKDHISPLSKALGIQARTLELLEDLDTVEPFLEQGSVNGRVNLIIKGKKRGGFNLSEIGQGFSAYPYMLTLPQNQTEEILNEALQANGQSVQWDTELMNFEQTDQGVTAQIRRADGRVEEVQADYLVGCDGARSAVRKKLGLDFKGDTASRYFYVLDTQLQWEEEDGSDLYACLCQHGFAAIIGMPGTQRFRIIGMMPKSFDQPDAATLEDLVQRFKIDSELEAELVNTSWHAVYKVHTRKADAFQKGRCFIAGDAAHVHTPAGGQGMNTGIQDAYNLAWKLQLVLQGHATPALLETYNGEREKNARQLLKGTDRAFSIQTGEGTFTNFIRLNIFPRMARWLFSTDFLKRKLFPIFSQINICYPESALSSPSQWKGVRAGDRLPYFEWADGQKSYDLVKGSRYHLLSAQPLEAGILPKYATWVAHTVWPEQHFGSATADLMILLRPDNYIAYIGNDPKAIQHYFEKACFAPATALSS